MKAACRDYAGKIKTNSAKAPRKRSFCLILRNLKCIFADDDNLIAEKVAKLLQKCEKCKENPEIMQDCLLRHDSNTAQ